MVSPSHSSEPLSSRHVLQRLHSPSRGISAFVHLAGLSSFAASYKFIFDHPTFAYAFSRMDERKASTSTDMGFLAHEYHSWDEQQLQRFNTTTMHITALNAPMRTSVLGGRLSSTTLTPFVFSGSCSAATPFPSTQQYYVKPQKTQQKRLASTKSASRIRLPQQPAAAELRSTILNATSTRQRQSGTPLQNACSVRKASTQASTAAPSSTAAGSSASPDSGALLDWNTFFKLRASRRRYTLVSSILSSLTTTAVGVQVLSMQNLDSLGTQVMGFDPFVVLGLATVTCGAAGWLAGPFLGNAFWGALHRKYKGGVSKKEKEFFDRIKRFRVDPSSNSFANPVPDYYGEKIGSVRDYRQWLKDQRAYNRKKRSFV
ncbi:TIM23 complex component [Arachnomyces sp. PD_36]|nr:TIM23 complex component [Arachnomyces sp. PD_36]